MMTKQVYDLKVHNRNYPFDDRTLVAHCNKVQNFTPTRQRVVDRRTQWGNPFRIDSRNSRQDVIIAYFNHLLDSPQLRDRLVDLQKYNRFLCHCAPLDCHADVLAAFVDVAPIVIPQISHRLSLAYSQNDFRYTGRFGTTFIRGRDLYSVVRVTLEKFKLHYTSPDGA